MATPTRASVARQSPLIREKGVPWDVSASLRTRHSGVKGFGPSSLAWGQSVRVSSTTGRAAAVNLSSAPPWLMGLRLPNCEMELDRADANALELRPPHPQAPASLTGMPFPEDRMLGPELGTYIKIAHV